MTASTFQVGAYQAGEGQITHRHRLSRPGQDTLVVACHGRTPAAAAGQACLQFAQNGGGIGPHLAALANNGYYVLGIDAGGNLTWGNAASETAVGNAVTWGRANGAHPTKKIVLLGYSMGGAVALNYAHNNPGQVAGLILEAPGVDLGYFYANGYASELDAAYGGSYTTNGQARNPQSFAGALTTPLRLYSALDDPTVPNSVVHAFYNALPTGLNKALTDLPGGGHADFWQYIDNVALLNWLGTLSY